MKNDSLEPWIRAYREENPGDDLDSLAVRRRVVAALGRRQLRRARWLRTLVPLAATFAGTAALAATDEGRWPLEQLRDWLAPTVQEPEATSSARAKPARAKIAKPETPVVPPRPEPSSEPGSALPVEDLPLAAKHLPASPSSRSPVDPPNTEPTDAALRADLALYRDAHRRHFHGSDEAGALQAWDRYIARFPSGAFAPEARLNRAICLLRLGRRAEAKRALEPIAAGRFGPNGRARAESLLDAIVEDDPED